MRSLLSRKRLSPEIIAIASKDCFVVPGDAIDWTAVKTKTALAYQLEQFLPLDAEELCVCQQRFASNNHRSVLVACERSTVEGLIQELEDQDQWIACVSPKAILAAQSFLMRHVKAANVNLALEGDKGQWDLILIRNRICQQWQWGNGEAALAWIAETPMVESEVPRWICCTTNESQERIRSLADLSMVQTAVAAQDELIDLVRAAIMRRDFISWFDFRNGELPTKRQLLPIARTVLACCAVVIAMLVALLGMELWQTNEILKQQQAAEDSQLAIFNSLYPSQRIPTDVVGRLQSEKRILKRQQEELTNVPKVESALPVLVKLINELTADTVFRIDRFNIRSDRITSLDGAAVSLIDFDQTISHLKTAGFRFSPPSTIQMADGYSMRLEQIRLEPKASN